MLTPCRRARVPDTFVRCEVYLLNNSIATQNVSIAVPIYVATLITLGTASGMVLFEVRHSEPCMPWRTDPHRVLGHELDPFHLWCPSSAGVPLVWMDGVCWGWFGVSSARPEGFCLHRRNTTTWAMTPSASSGTGLSS